MDFEERCETRLNAHSEKIRALETSDAMQSVMIEQLCEKLDSLISWMKALLIAWITGAVGLRDGSGGSGGNGRVLVIW